MFIRAIRSVTRFARGRRAFLRLAAVSGGAAVAASMIKDAVAEAPEKAIKAKPAPASKGYRETEHIREYYNKARF